MTLKDFKAAIDREGNHRYHFKALDPEFGTVKEEVQNLPGSLSGLVVFFCFVFRAAPSAYGSSQAGVQSELGVPVLAQWLTNLTRNHEVVCSIPGLAQWVKDPALP